MTTNSTIIRKISYGTDGVNRVGLNPVSGRLDENGPRQREQWAQEFARNPFNVKAREFGAYYAETIIKPVEHDRGAHRDIVGEAIDELIDPDGYPVPAHEDIFDTVVLPAIIDADDILLPADEDENDPLFFGVSHWSMQD